MLRIAIRNYLRALGLLCLCLPFGLPAQSRSRNYYGKYVGRLVEFAHGIRGEVFAVDDTTLFIKGFSYDGTGPDAFFWVGSSPRPSPDGEIIPYPEVSTGSEPKILKAYRNHDVILRLPVGKKIRDIKWLSVWCRRFTVNFGEVFIPPNQDTPKTRMLPEFKRLAHGLRSGNITILDSKTFYIPNLHYDGAGPDAYFWVGNGSEPSSLGIKVPNEMGSLAPLRGYQGEDIEIQLPGNLSVHDIDWLAVWCVEYRHNFGHVHIPKDLDVPPALGQTKVSPPWWYEPTTSTTPEPFQEGHVFTNCQELLDERLQVNWDMLTSDEIKVKLSARIRGDQYMAFGLSGEDGRSAMVGGDIVVAYYDPQEHTFHAEDYYMSATAQCDGNSGVCPDSRIGGRNDAVLITGTRQDGVTSIIYKRPLQTNEPIKDRAIPPHGLVNVIAAIGALNSRKEANAHGMSDKTADDVKMDFSSTNDNRCRASLYTAVEEEKVKPWPPQVIVGEKNFTVRIGPTGGKRGYTPITGHPSWGIAWWINEKLIPELYLERGQTYTFLVEGGNDRTNPARYHPFYITDSNEGGYGQKDQDQQKEQKVYAGVETDEQGYPFPTAVGRYCEYMHKTIDRSLTSETFDEYRKTLKLECDPGEPSTLTWTVPQDAPNLLYYQCYTHNNLGWKIHVVNPGFHAPQNAAPSAFSSAVGYLFFLGASLSLMLAR